MTEETHEFRQGKYSCLYSTIRCFIQNVSAIDNKDVQNLVKIKIRQIELNNNLSNGSNENNMVIKKTCEQIKEVKTIDNERELAALVLICRLIFSVVFVTKNDQVTTSVHVRYFGRNSLSFQQCAYIIYDETHKHYAPLYLINKNNPNELTTIFDRNNAIVRIFLRKFIKEDLKYDKFVQLDDQIDVMASEVSPRVQHESDNIPCIIALNTRKDTTKRQMAAKGGERLIMSNSTMKTSNTNGDIQLTSSIKTNISNTTHEFRRKNVPRDGSCLYWSFIDVFGKLKRINMKSLRNKVADFVRDMDIDNTRLLSDAGCETRAQYCNKIRNNEWGGEPELLALTEMYSIVIGVVNKVIDEQGTLSVNVINYGESNQSFKKCVYIIYDRAANHYEPLYLCDKNNPNEYITIFDRCDTVINTLLKDFIRKQCHCDGHETLGNARICCQDDISNKSTDVLDNHQLPTIKATISDKTHEFRIGELPGDDQCLFSSAIYLFDRCQTINIKSLRKKVANFIREWKDIEDIRLLSNTNCRTREDYCLKIEEGTIWGSEPERHALAYFYPDILFCVISKINNKNESSIHIDTYVKDISSYKKCVIIVYDVAANNYIPLYLYDKINQEEEKTNFNYNDTVKKILEEFIQKTFNYRDYINFDNECTGYEVDTQSHVESEFVDVSNKISMNTITNASKKRKICEDDEYLLNVDVTKKSTSIANHGNQSSKYSRSLPAADVTSKLDNQNDTPIDIAKLLQADFFVQCNAMKQQQISVPSIAVSSNTKPINNEQEEKKMRLETEPMKNFRGRTKHEYKPKNAFKRNGQPSTVNPPSYVADRFNNHWLSLLISETYLLCSYYQIVLEICIVTGDINGCIYVNPYFKFQVDHENRQSLDRNPMFLVLQENELKRTFLEGMRKILLYLVVIKLTERELIEDQPIKIFPSPKSNRQSFIKEYESVDQFKQAYHLDEIRFAFTLWIKESREKGFCRHDEMQYISEISIQNAKTKVQK